jgi:hypothetical protein
MDALTRAALGAGNNVKGQLAARYLSERLGLGLSLFASQAGHEIRQRPRAELR